MTETESEEVAGDSDESPAPSRHDPIMTLFVAGAMILLAALAILIVIAAGNPPAGL
jgi:hypothetical protein